MHKIKLSALLLASWTILGTTAGLLADDAWGRSPGWLGAFWQDNPEVERILGIDSKMNAGKFPTRLHLSNFLDKQAAVEVMGAESLQKAEARFSKMKHRLISAGQWKAEPDFDGFAGKDSLFFVTRHEGATFLWFGTPHVTLKGAEVHYIHGAKSEHDLLVLDYGFSNFRARLYSGNTVGYRRADN